MYPDTVVNAIRPGLTGRVVGRDDEGFVTGSTQMLEDAQHRVADTVDIREEGFGDDCNAHHTTMAASTVGKVAYGHTSCEICWSDAFDAG